MKNIDILIIVESKVRELESACLLKSVLEKQNYSVEIASLYPNKERLIYAYKAKFIISPWAYNDRDMEYLSCFYRYSDTKIINLHHEQYSGNDIDNACLPKGKARDIYHISWEKKFTDGLLELGCKPENICEAGNIRLDFFNEKFKDLSISRKKLAINYNISFEKKWVLFIANGYHLANDIEINKMSTIDKNVRKKAEISKKNRLYFLEYIDNYLMNNGDIIFIYRPHPSFSYLDETDERIVYLKNKYPHNFKCIYEYSIKEWIINCDISCSIHSTAGVECLAANKPFYLIRVVPMNENLDYEFYKNYSSVIKDYASFISVLNENIHSTFEDKSKFLEYYNIGNKLSYEIICDFVNKLNKIESSNRASYFYLIKMFIKMVIKILLIYISRSKFGEKIISYQNDSRYNHIIENETDIIDQSEIEEIQKKFRSIISEN